MEKKRYKTLFSAGLVELKKFYFRNIFMTRSCVVVFFGKELDDFIASS
jgi:hypothetical protein